MLWKLTAVVLCGLISSVLSEDADVKPRLRIMVRSSVYNVGDKKAIYCKGENLVDDIEWYNPQDVVVENRSPKNTRVFVEKLDSSQFKKLVPLMFQSTRTEDSGNWTCKSGDLHESIDILVGEKASTVSFKSHIEVNEGQNAVLNCIVKGYPIPDIQWYQDGATIKEDGKHVLQREDNNLRLIIKSTTHKDSGEYTCRITQKALSYYNDSKLYLGVRHKPVMEFDSTQEVFAIINETKNITCGAIANPPPVYKWFRRNNGFQDTKLSPIIAEDSIIVAEDNSSSVLVVHVYNASNLGEYMCQATNSRGKESVIFHLNQGNKPSPPDLISCIHESVNELTFNVTCSSCNMESDVNVAPQPDNLRVLGYSFELVPVVDGLTIPDWDNATEYLVDIEDPANTTFTVGPLTNSTSFYVRVRSRNAAGFSEWLVLEAEKMPTTTAFAVTLFSSMILLILSYFIVVMMN